MDPELLVYIGNNYGHLQTLFNLGAGHSQHERFRDGESLSIRWVRGSELHRSVTLGQRVHFYISRLRAGGDLLSFGGHLEAEEVLGELVL